MSIHRFQMLLEEDRYQQVAREAERRHISVAALIRELVDQHMEADVERRRAAMARILAAAPMEVPEDPADIRRELDEAHDRIRPC